MVTSKNIFLVEDDVDDQLFFTECIANIDSATLYGVAHNGIEALEKLEYAAELPDMIFMDVNMPFMNGLDCLAEIRKKPRSKNIPVVMLSTDTGKAQLTRALGAKAFIKKPCDGKLLLQKIEQMINLDLDANYTVANE